MIEYLELQIDLVRVEIESRLGKVLRSGERGSGGPSLESLWLAAGGVALAVGLLAWLAGVFTSKEATLTP